MFFVLLGFNTASVLIQQENENIQSFLKASFNTASVLIQR